jgi:hypothetical protein
MNELLVNYTLAMGAIESALAYLDDPESVDLTWLKAELRETMLTYEQLLARGNTAQ